METCPHVNVDSPAHYSVERSSKFSAFTEKLHQGIYVMKMARPILRQGNPDDQLVLKDNKNRAATPFATYIL